MDDTLKCFLNDVQISEYDSFKEFCQKKMHGLRKDSLSALGRFINQTQTWSEAVQQDFLCWFFTLLEKCDSPNDVLVYPLEEGLLKPALKQWMVSEPKDHRPFRWFGLFLNDEDSFTYLKLALELDASDQTVLTKIIDVYLHGLWYSFHHISEDLYLGSVEEDRELIANIEKLNEELADNKHKQENTNAVNYYRDLLNDWISFKEQHQKGFVLWCEDHGRNYKWTQAFYYSRTNRGKD